MNYNVVEVPDGTLLIDCLSPLDAVSLARLSAANYGGRGIDGCFRYVENMTIEERDRILSARTPSGKSWGLMTVGMAHGDSMRTPNAGLGSRDGLRAVALLRQLGILPGVTHGLDAERIDVPLQADDVVAYENAAVAVIRTVTEAAFYEGWDIPLSAAALYARLASRLYWASSPKSLPPERRGFACVQLVENITLAGVRVDVDECNADLLGSRCHWMQAA